MPGEVQVSTNPATEVTEFTIKLAVDFDKSKLAFGDASYADMVFMEIKRSWDAAWLELLTSVMATQVQHA